MIGNKQINMIKSAAVSGNGINDFSLFVKDEYGSIARYDAPSLEALTDKVGATLEFKVESERDWNLLHSNICNRVAEAL